MTVAPLGDSALVITLGEVADLTMARRVQSVTARLRAHSLPGLIDVVPAFASIALFFDARGLTEYETVRAQVEAAAAEADREPAGDAARTVEIPVCYGGVHGPDLEDVAARAHCAVEEVVRRHAAGAYFVQAIGFTPGFPYLGGLPEELATPRRATPRARVPAGTVGIGGRQTGVYSLETPGGWNLIGRTPLHLFEATQPEPSRLRLGDQVTFHPLPPTEFVPPPGSVPAAPEQAGSLRLIRAGMHSTVQDLGRLGWRGQGVPSGGAADEVALRVANLLAGNSEDAAALEVTHVGPEVEFLQDTVVALGGAEFDALPSWRPVRVAAGTTIKLAAARRGFRGYLAVSGGIDVPRMLGSRSTYVRAGLGGVRGRVLRDGDRLVLGSAARTWRGSWQVDPRILPAYAPEVTVRVIGGAQAREFPEQWMDATYRVSRQSDRMGVRLEGPGLRRSEGTDLLSSPVAPGTIQVPPDGQPIVLLADAQTIGGYPKLAHVATVDLPLLAQLRPGDSVRFRRISFHEARALRVARENALAILREGVGAKWR